MKLASFFCAGALELWELAEDECLLVNRFTKHDHDHIVTTVSPVVGATAAVTGSMDCRLDLFYMNIHTPFHLSQQSRSNVNCFCFKLWLNTFLSCHPLKCIFAYYYRIKVWDLSQETVVTTYNGKHHLNSSSYRNAQNLQKCFFPLNVEKEKNVYFW